MTLNQCQPRCCWLKKEKSSKKNQCLPRCCWLRREESSKESVFVEAASNDGTTIQYCTLYMYMYIVYVYRNMIQSKCTVKLSMMEQQCCICSTYCLWLTSPETDIFWIILYFFNYEMGSKLKKKTTNFGKNFQFEKFQPNTIHCLSIICIGKLDGTTMTYIVCRTECIGYIVYIYSIHDTVKSKALNDIM